jgi:hypothetical protein
MARTYSVVESRSPFRVSVPRPTRRSARTVGSEMVTAQRSSSWPLGELGRGGRYVTGSIKPVKCWRVQPLSSRSQPINSLLKFPPATHTGSLPAPVGVRLLPRQGDDCAWHHGTGQHGGPDVGVSCVRPRPSHHPRRAEARTAQRSARPTTQDPERPASLELALCSGLLVQRGWATISPHPCRCPTDLHRPVKSPKTSP